MAKEKPKTISGTNGDAPDVAYVTPTLITWALRRSRLPEKTVAQKLRVDERLVQAWTTSSLANRFNDVSASTRIRRTQRRN